MNFQERNHNNTPIDSDAKTFTETCNLNTNLPLLHQNSRFNGQQHEQTVKTPIYRLKTRTNGKNFKKPIESSNKRWKTSNYRLKTQTNGGKLQFTEQKLKRTVKNAENGCTSTQPRKNRRNFKNSRCGWETRFTRPHGGRLMILPVDSSARVLPRQRFLLLDQPRTTLASVLQASIPRKNLKETEWCRCGRSRSNAQVSDGITKYSERKAKLKEPCKYSLSVLKSFQKRKEVF